MEEREMKNVAILMVTVAMALLSGLPAAAAWSHKTGDPVPENTPSHLLQPFSQAEWEASNFAAEKDLQWFRDAKYGMFICFGLSTHMPSDLSWGMCRTRKAPDCGNGPIADDIWQSWTKEFKIEKFDAREWVEIARRGGFKYIVLVVKHHDGFHLWDTAQSDFKVTKAPFGRDFTKEIVDACHAAKMPIGIYYSQRDWHHPDYCPVDPAKVVQKGIHWTLKPGEKSPMGDRHQKYIEYQNQAIEELCTKYGKIDIFWWDACWYGGMFTAEMWDAETITRKIRQWQPGIIINNRCSVPGDFDTPEQRLGSYQDWRPWESCICLTASWSYSGTAAKSRDQLIRMIVNNLCGDGNLLLSWGPRWNGEYAETEKARLIEIGDWLARNGQAVYGTRGGPWKFSDWGGSVRKGKTVYLHALKLDNDTLRLPAIPNRKVVSARLLGGDPIPCRQENGAVRISVPKEKQTAPDTIVELTMDQSVDGLPAIAAGQPSIFTDSATYGKLISAKATVKASSTCEFDPPGGLQALVGKAAVEDFAFCTAPEKNPWIEIDLGKEIAVAGVRIVNRSRCNPERAANLSLSVSKDGKTWDKAWIAPRVQDTWEVPITDFLAGAQVAGRKARYLRLETHNDRPTYFHLKKVDVYGKE
jgi:alpha-L-fucosidase